MDTCTFQKQERKCVMPCHQSTVLDTFVMLGSQWREAGRELLKFETFPGCKYLG